MTIGIILQLLFGILSALWIFAYGLALNVIQANKRVASFVLSQLVALYMGAMGMVVFAANALDAFAVVFTIGRFASAVINLTPVSLLAFFRPVQQLMFAFSGIYGKTVIILISTGIITAPLMLHVFPIIQDAVDEDWCYIFQYETFLDFLLALITDVYNKIVPIFNYFTSWLFGQIFTLLKDLAPFILAGFQIVMRVIFDPEAVLILPTHGGNCQGYQDSILFPSVIEQIRCLALQVIQIVVNDVILDTIKAIPVVGPAIEPLAHDILWIYIDLIANLNYYLFGGFDLVGCIIPSPMSASGCWVCSLGAPPGPACCLVSSIPCVFIRFFAIGQRLLDLIFLLLESIPGIGDVLKFIAKLGAIITGVINKYIIDPIDIVLKAVLTALIWAINNIILLPICFIVRIFNGFCLNCIGNLGSGSYCGWQITPPTQLIGQITFPIPELSGASSSLPAALGGGSRRLMQTDTNSSNSTIWFPEILQLPPYPEPYDGVSVAFATLWQQVRTTARQGPSQCRTDLPILAPGMHSVFHPDHYAINAQGCTSHIPVLHSEVRHPGYPGYEDASVWEQRQAALAASVYNTTTGYNITGTSAQRRLLLGLPSGSQLVGDASPIARVLKNIVLSGGAYVSIGVKMMFAWVVTTLAPALDVLPHAASTTVSGSVAIGDLQNAVAEVAVAFRIPNKNNLGTAPGQSAISLFDPRTWVSFLANDVLIVSSGIFAGVPAIASITTEELSNEMKKLDTWADDLVLNNLQALTRFLEFIDMIFMDLLSFNLQKEFGLLANLYKQIQCDTPDTYDGRLRPHGMWRLGCLLHGQLPVPLPVPLVLLPDNIDWGVPCLTGPLTCKGFAGVTHLTSQGRCIQCKCPGAGYALCDTIYPSGMHLLAGLITGLVEVAVSATQGVVSLATIAANGGVPPPGAENGLEFGVPQFINFTVDIFFDIPYGLTVNITSVRLVTLFPLLEQFLELGLDSTGASTTRAAFAGIVIYTTGSTPASTSAIGEPMIGLNGGIACILVRLPSIFWAIVVIIAWIAAYLGALTVLFEIGILVYYLLFGAIALAASLLAWFFVAMTQVAMQARLNTLERSTAALQGGGSGAVAQPPASVTGVASLPTSGRKHGPVSVWKVMADDTPTNQTRSRKRRAPMHAAGASLDA